MDQNYFEYTVESDDSLFGLELKFEVNQSEIMHVNSISEYIYPGQIIRIPKKKPSMQPLPQHRSGSFIGVNIMDDILSKSTTKYHDAYYITQKGFVRGLFSVHADLICFDPDLHDKDNLQIIQKENLKHSSYLQVQILVKHLQNGIHRILPTRITDNSHQPIRDQCLQLTIQTNKKKILFFEMINQDSYAEVVSDIHNVLENDKLESLVDIKTQIPYYFDDNEYLQQNLSNAFTRRAPDSFCSDLLEISQIINQDQLMSIMCNLPIIFKSQTWKLIFSCLKHGSSLATLIRQCENQSPVILVMKDTEEYVFGAYLNDGLKVTKQFYGSGESFLFTFKDTQQCEAYKWSSLNQDFTFCDLDGVAIGCGDKYGLYINSQLSGGYSQFCETFLNDQLSKSQNFVINNLEIWTIL